MTAEEMKHSCYRENVTEKTGQEVYPFLSPAELTAGYERDQGSAVPQGSAAPDIRRILDSKKVSDHHAIIPTIMITRADLSKCSEEEKKILTLIAARLVSATGRKFVYEAVKATFSCCGYTFVAYGRNIMEEGWKTAESAMRSHLHVEQEETLEADPDEGKKASCRDGEDPEPFFSVSGEAVLECEDEGNRPLDKAACSVYRGQPSCHDGAGRCERNGSRRGTKGTWDARNPGRHYRKTGFFKICRAQKQTDDCHRCRETAGQCYA
jgi:hypothetical protein